MARKSVETRQRIIDTAMRLFQQHGYSNVKVIDIVRESGIAHGSFYTYFKSKDDLLSIYFDVIEDAYYKNYEKYLNDPQYRDLDPLDKIYHFLLECNRIATNYGKAFIRAYHAYLIKETHILAAHTSGYFALLESLIDQARAKGEINPSMSNQHILQVAVALTRGTRIEWSIEESSADIGEKDNFFREFCLYIAAPGVTPHLTPL